MKITKSIINYLINIIDNNGYEFTLISDNELKVLNKNKETINIIVKDNCYILEYKAYRERLYKSKDVLDKIERV